MGGGKLSKGGRHTGNAFATKLPSTPPHARSPRVSPPHTLPQHNTHMQTSAQPTQPSVQTMQRRTHATDQQKRAN